MSKLSDSWQTPQELFDELDKEFGPFDIDLCATKENSKCEWYYEDYLIGKVHEDFYSYDLTGFKTAFMNPPYSNPLPFVQKAWEDSKHCKIVLLLKVDPSTKWWSVFWDHGSTCSWCKGEGELRNNEGFWGCIDCNETGIYRGIKPGCEVRFLPKRVKFDPPQEVIDSGEVWEVGNKWVQKCHSCRGHGNNRNPFANFGDSNDCYNCKGKGYTKLSGPSFPSCIVIFNRRNIDE